jgi:hypothetical protein
MKAATNTSDSVPGFHKPEVKPLIHQPTECIKLVTHLVFVFWLLSGVARRHPYSQRTHAEADRQDEGH